MTGPRLATTATDEGWPDGADDPHPPTRTTKARQASPLLKRPLKLTEPAALTKCPHTRSTLTRDSKFPCRDLQPRRAIHGAGSRRRSPAAVNGACPARSARRCPDSPASPAESSATDPADEPPATAGRRCLHRGESTPNLGRDARSPDHSPPCESQSVSRELDRRTWVASAILQPALLRAREFSPEEVAHVRTRPARPTGVPYPCEQKGTSQNQRPCPTICAANFSGTT